jgi:hypothetical protein
LYIWLWRDFSEEHFRFSFSEQLQRPPWTVVSCFAVKTIAAIVPTSRKTTSRRKLSGIADSRIAQNTLF